MVIEQPGLQPQPALDSDPAFTVWKALFPQAKRTGCS